MMLPRRKEPAVATTAPGVTVLRTEYGKRGSVVKRGMGLEKAVTERTKRLHAIGSQIMGTTYHFVRVKI